MVDLKKIMVVDDEAGIRSLLFDVLSNQGFKVTLAKDGRESLDRMEGSCFDLLITDIDMPRLNGLDLLKTMKKTGRREKVILMSGRPMDRTDLGGDMPPVFSLLQKPFPLGNFLEVVSSALTPSGNPGLKRARVLSRERKERMISVL